MSWLETAGYKIIDLQQQQKGFGLYSTRLFNEGEGIYQFDYWSEEVMPIHMTNHSCNPNASFNEDGLLVALRTIPAGEEITYHYLVHPIPASPWNFKCQCKSDNCLGWIMAGAKI